MSPKISDEVVCQASRLLRNPVIAVLCMCTVRVCHVSVRMHMHRKARGRCWVSSSITPPNSFETDHRLNLEFTALARWSGRCHAQGHDDPVEKGPHSSDLMGKMYQMCPAF